MRLRTAPGWITALFAVLAFPSFVQAELHLITWNLTHLGDDDKNIEDVVQVLRGRNGEGQFLKGSSSFGPDLILLQEVNPGKTGTEAARQIQNELSHSFKTPYCIGFSKAIPKAKERFAFLWKNSAIKYVTTQGEVKEECIDHSSVFIPSVEHEILRGKMARPPAVGIFMEVRSHRRFLAANVHLVPTRRKPEREVGSLFLNVMTYEFSTYPKIIAGDFNLASGHEAFREWTGSSVEKPLVTEKMRVDYPSLVNQGTFSAALGPKERTSLQSKRRLLSQAYDNVFYEGFQPSGSGAVVQNLFEVFKDSTIQEIKRTISDHSPVFVTLEFAATPQRQ